MVPDLRKSDYSAAALTGTTEVAQFIAADAGIQLTGLPQRTARAADKRSAVVAADCAVRRILSADSRAGARRTESTWPAGVWWRHGQRAAVVTAGQLPWAEAAAVGAADLVAAPAVGAAAVVADLVDLAAA